MPGEELEVSIEIGAAAVTASRHWSRPIPWRIFAYTRRSNSARCAEDYRYRLALPLEPGHGRPTSSAFRAIRRRFALGSSASFAVMPGLDLLPHPGDPEEGLRAGRARRRP